MPARKLAQAQKADDLPLGYPVYIYFRFLHEAWALRRGVPGSPLVGLLVVLHHAHVPPHVDIDRDEADGDTDDVAQHPPGNPAIRDEQDVA